MKLFSQWGGKVNSWINFTSRIWETASKQSSCSFSSLKKKKSNSEELNRWMDFFSQFLIALIQLSLTHISASTRFSAVMHPPALLPSRPRAVQLWGDRDRAPTMSADAVCRAELDSEHHSELCDMVASMDVTASRMTPPNGYRPGPPRTTGGNRVRLSDRKLSLQERGSRIARQPTIETKRVSITDADVRSHELNVVRNLAQHLWYLNSPFNLCRTVCSLTSISWRKRLERWSVWWSVWCYSSYLSVSVSVKLFYLQPAGFIWSGEVGV